jgi:HlyD family secretion protein
VFRRGDKWAVFVVDGGRARERIVELGRRNSTDAQITTGLDDGQAVVLHPPDTLRDGVRVIERPA